MISIVIPSLNEERYLPLLLSSIEDNNFSDKEIILADAGSTDKTLEIAKRYNCIIAKGGLPAFGRNEGAKLAKGDIILFLDSDVIVSSDFLDRSVKEFKDKNFDIASFCLIPSSNSKIVKFLLNIFYNYPILVLEKILPHAAMGIMVKTDFFHKTGGFDMSIKLAEDHYFARFAKSKFKAKVGLIKSSKLFISDRRFKADGWVATGLKYLFCELYMIFIGPAKSNIFVYKFNHYKKEEPKIKK